MDRSDALGWVIFTTCVIAAFTCCVLIVKHLAPSC